MGWLDNPFFWSNAASTVGRVQTDGSLKYILLDKTYRMMPLIRNSSITFTDFLMSDSDARKCKIIVNGNFYDLDLAGKFSVGMRLADNPRDTLIEGQVVKDGQVVAGDSRPQSFWFGLMMVPTGDAWSWTYAAGKGDPPTGGGVLAAIGGVGPLIVGALRYGIGNLYKPGAPPDVSEPPTGQPPDAVMPYLIQRSNATFAAANILSPETGKTILAYCSQMRTLLVAVQPHGVGPGQTHDRLAMALAQRGFESAVFLDGSDSATLVVDGEVLVKPGDRKNDSIDVGIGFYI